MVQAGPGIADGHIAARLDICPDTLSNNLTKLTAVGLVRRAARDASSAFSWIKTTGGVLGFLPQDCCGGHPDLCRQMRDQIACG